MNSCVFFNPFTGKPRHPSDIASDPQGMLVRDEEAPLLAYKPSGDSAATGTEACLHKPTLMSAFKEGMQIEGWFELPQRLRGRGDWLIQRGRIKDSELMFDAALCIEALREQVAKATGAQQ